MKRLISVIVCAFCAISINAATIHVPADQPTIQAGINVGGNGDTVLVAPGTYSENVLINGKSIVTRSILGADSTIIQPADSTVELVAIVNGVSSQAKFEGFMLWFSGEDQGWM